MTRSAIHSHKFIVMPDPQLVSIGNSGPSCGIFLAQWVTLRPTKIIREVKHLSCEDRLRELGLQLWGDLIMTLLCTVKEPIRKMGINLLAGHDSKVFTVLPQAEAVFSLLYSPRSLHLLYKWLVKVIWIQKFINIYIWLKIIHTSLETFKKCQNMFSYCFIGA